MYEYRTASFVLAKCARGGRPLEEVDQALAGLVQAGWEFVQLTSSISWGGMSVVLVVRRAKASSSA